ncbi:MAG: glycosyltransferase family 87 protein [Candidatus Sulfotelmatobacter sp.]|jgi:glycosyl transferase family 87
MPQRSVLLQSSSVFFLVILGAAGMVYYHLGIFVPGAMEVRASEGLGNGYSFGADFYPLWLTTHEGMLHHSDPYSPETTRRIQIGLFGRPLDDNSSLTQDPRAFANPAFAELLFWPLALIPFPVLRIGLAVILAAVTAFSIVLWLRAIRFQVDRVMLASLILLTLSSYSVLEGLFAEQIGLLVGFLLAAALAALAGQRLFLSGSLMALALVKPQMMLLVAIYLLLWSLARWRARRLFAAGFISVSALLAGSSLLIWPHWISEWLQVLIRYRQYSTPPLACYVLGGYAGSHFGPVLVAALLAGALALAWRMRNTSSASFEFALTISLLLATTVVTLLPGQAVYDHVILLPGIILIAMSWRGFAALNRIFRVVLGAGALALFWQWICAPFVIAAQPFLSSRVFTEAVLTLPIRTAASIPFGVLAVLALMMRQTALRQNYGREKH